VYRIKTTALLLILSTAIISSCAYRPGISRKDLKHSISQSEIFAKNFTGFALYDVELNKMVYEENSSKYFTPASNTKLLTFYAGIRLLGDSIPALKYTICNDSLIFRGTGDPTFLHPSFNFSKVYDFLNNRPEKLFYTSQKYSGEALGPGWSWDWYKYSYFTEKAPFPIYGNLVRFNINNKDSLPTCKPAYFSRFIQKKGEALNKTTPVFREVGDNVFLYNGDAQQGRSKLDFPFKYSPDLLIELLSDTLNRSVGLLGEKKCSFDKTIYSVPSDSVYKKMLQESDNFLAEQLLLLYTSEVLDSLNSDMAIKFIKDSLYKDMPDKLIWVDGSGISRYNLVTPRSLVHVLNKIYKEVPQERLFHLLPSGGVNGTLKDFYKGTKEPYIYAKSGTLTNNISLSGYLITKSGKPLIFSFMHNNFVNSSNPIKKEMEKVLREIYEKY
jgi:D-alanyl-D-alanine carboxypeptidase/D-alanyl-D-alanine-endopeptidase (penicillin-binding protein 4)